jgi:hypothetical protein
MKGKSSGRKTTSNVVYFVLSAVTVFLIIGFVSLNVIGGAAEQTDSGTEMAISRTKSPPSGGTQTSGGNPSGVKVRKTFTIHQDKYGDFATDLHFKIWQKEDNININGWHVEISHFGDSSSQRGNQPEPAHSNLKNLSGRKKTSDPDNGQHAVDVVADGGEIPYCTKVKVKVTYWLTSYNTIRAADINWSKEEQLETAALDTAFEVGDPVENPVNPGQYIHPLTITNDDPTAPILVSGLTYMATMVYYDDLTMINYSSSPEVDEFFLAPGESRTIDVTTTGPFYGGHIYFKYDVTDYGAGTTAYQVLGADHPITPVIY